MSLWIACLLFLLLVIGLILFLKKKISKKWRILGIGIFSFLFVIFGLYILLTLLFFMEV